MEAIVGEYMARQAAQIQSTAQIKLFKGALEQEGEVVMKLINSAVASPSAQSRQPFPTGHTLNVTA